MKKWKQKKFFPPKSYTSVSSSSILQPHLCLSSNFIPKPIHPTPLTYLLYFLKWTRMLPSLIFKTQFECHPFSVKLLQLSQAKWAVPLPYFQNILLWKTIITNWTAMSVSSPSLWATLVADSIIRMKTLLKGSLHKASSFYTTQIGH